MVLEEAWDKLAAEMDCLWEGELVEPDCEGEVVEAVPWQRDVLSSCKLAIRPSDYTYIIMLSLLLSKPEKSFANRRILLD